MHTSYCRIIIQIQELRGEGTPRGREPLHAGAERVPWWELAALASHVHPSVAAMARSLLAGAPVVYNGDPLRDLSLTAFLDTFVQRKPKARSCSHQPLPSDSCIIPPLPVHYILFWS